MVTPLASGRYFSERGDAVAKASKETHVVSGLSNSLSVEAGLGWGEESERVYVMKRDNPGMAYIP